MGYSLVAEQFASKDMQKVVPGVALHALPSYYNGTDLGLRRSGLPLYLAVESEGGPLL